MSNRVTIEIDLDSIQYEIIKYAEKELDMIEEGTCDCITVNLSDYDTYEIIEELENRNGEGIYDAIGKIPTDIVTITLLKDFLEVFTKIPREKLEKAIQKYK